MTRAAAVLILLLVAAPFDPGLLPHAEGRQDESTLRRLLQMLDDDSIDVRASSEAELSRMGRSVIPSLQTALLDAGPELRDRLGDIIRKIQEREKLSSLLPPPSYITLEAKNRPLSEVLQGLGKQSRTPIDLTNVPADARVTVSLRKAPYWAALEEICRASGKIMATPDEEHIAITAEPYVALPQLATSLFRATLQRIDLTSSGTLGQPDRFDHLSAALDLAWEKGARPWRVSGRITELIDESGDDATSEELGTPQLVPPEAIHLELPLDARGPGPQAAKIARMKIEVVLEFPLRFLELKLPVAGGKIPPPLDCSEFSVRILRFDKQEGILTATMGLTPGAAAGDGDLIPETILLKDQKGTEYPGQVRVDGQPQENEIRFDVFFHTAAQAQAPWKEIVIRTPAEVHREKLDIDWKDIPLR